MRYVLLALALILIIGCSPDVKTGKAADLDREEILSGYDKRVTENLKPIEVDDDPKKSEVLLFCKQFIQTLQFPEVAGYPATPDPESFKMLGFVPDENNYLVIIGFRLRTMEGPKNKQFTFHMMDLGESTYEIINLVENF